MGYEYTTYVVYGVRIAAPEGLSLFEYTEQLDTQLKGSGCSYLHVNAHTSDSLLFLCISDDGQESNEVPLGDYQLLAGGDPEEDEIALADWDAMLTRTLEMLQCTPGEPFGWIVAPDLS